MKPPRVNMIIIAVLVLGFIAFARYLVMVNQDIQEQISGSGQR